MRFLALSPLMLLAVPAHGQAMPHEGLEDAGDEVVWQGGEIIVYAGRIRGQVNAPQPPVLVLDEADIAAYGASSVSDLVDAVSPQAASGRGRGDGHPVMLVNGQRISSYRELRSIPPEAIRRMEVLPEEVALRYGYPPDQRIINFVLKDAFASKTVSGEYNVPTHGGFAESELEAGLLKIAGPSRLNVTAKLEDSSMLTEAERDVRQAQENIPDVATDPDPAAFRSLVDDSRTLSLNGTWSTGLGKDGQDGNLSLNAAITRSDTRSLFGLDTVLLVAPDEVTSLRRSLPGPLVRESRSTLFQTGLTLNKPVGTWLLAATLDASHGDTKTRVARKADSSVLVEAAAAGLLAIDGPLQALPDAGSDRAHTRDDALTTLATLAGSPFRLPAGEAALTVKAGFAYSASDNSDTRTESASRLKRGDLSGGINLALPLTSRKEGVLGAIGDVTLDFSADVNRLSDFGTLTGWSAGASWSPLESLALQASYIVNQEAPSLARLGNPELRAYNVTVYDFSRDEVALVTIVNGGNPDLSRETQRDLKLSATWDMPFLRRSNLIVEYFRNRSSDVTQDFPLLTPAIETAFPDRVSRDPLTGALLEIDRRPVTFDAVASSRLHWGINLSGALGKARQARGQGGGMALPGRGDGRGRWNLSLYHTYRFTERATLAAGGPELDLLGGDALVTGGVPRHALEMEGGGFFRGFGLRFKGAWNAPVHIRSGDVAGSTDLRFGSTLVLNLRLFVNLGQQPALVRSTPALKGVRLAFQFDNILDSRQKVTDSSGAVPLAYQADYRDPRGRFVGIDLRKMF